MVPSASISGSMGEFNVDTARVVDIESGAQTNLQQRLVQNAIRHAIVFFIGEQRGLMCGDSVDQALDERRVQARAIRRSCRALDLRNVFIGNG